MPFLEHLNVDEIPVLQFSWHSLYKCLGKTLEWSMAHVSKIQIIAFIKNS